MTNQETQLELDFGMLTVAQQERVDSFIKNQKEQVSNNIKNSNTHKLNTFEKNKIIKKEITKLFKKNLNNIRLEIENKYGKILDEDWLYYLSLLHKYLPILIKKRIYTKTISTQTQNNIKLLKTNLIEKTYL